MPKGRCGVAPCRDLELASSADAVRGEVEVDVACEGWCIGGTTSMSATIGSVDGRDEDGVAAGSDVGRAGGSSCAHGSVRRIVSGAVRPGVAGGVVTQSAAARRGCGGSGADREAPAGSRCAAERVVASVPGRRGAATRWWLDCAAMGAGSGPADTERGEASDAEGSGAGAAAIGQGKGPSDPPSALARARGRSRKNGATLHRAPG
jgi:hypothetical protein